MKVWYEKKDFGTKKICPKKIFVQNIFWYKNINGPKEFLVQKKFRVKNIFGLKTIFVRNFFGLLNTFWSGKNYGRKSYFGKNKTSVKKNIVQQKCLAENNF